MVTCPSATAINPSTKLQGQSMRFGIELPPLPIKNAALGRHQALLESSTGHIRPKLGLDGGNFPSPKALRPHQRAFAFIQLIGRRIVPRRTLAAGLDRNERLTIIVEPARILPTQACGAVPAGFVLHGDHQVRPFRGQIAGQDNPAHIVLVQPLHDDHDG